MDTSEKLRHLGAAADYDVAAPATRSARGVPREAGICRLAGRGGALLRVLMSDRCEHDCHFCPLRASAPRHRAAFAPEELAGLFTRLRGAGAVDGLFLSSAIDGSSEQTTERMLAVVELLRTRHEFSGYVHLTLPPGLTDATIDAAARLASRVSINVEVPSGAYLQRLGTGKDMLKDILRPLRRLRAMELQGHLASGISTQFVVGAAGESDREIVSSVRWLSDELGLRRAFFGMFRPVPGTPLEGRAAAHPNRQARLYQADWLGRVYKLDRDVIDGAFDGSGNLPLGVDPKVAAALASPRRFPVDVRSASYESLLLVPGIGPVAARRIVTLRREHSFTDLSQLKKAGVAVNRAAPFLLVEGRRPEGAAAYYAQLVRRRAASPGQYGVQLALPGCE